jgi:rhodanese-related sulfurtransferase
MATRKMATRIQLTTLALAFGAIALIGSARAQGSNVLQATLGEANQKTAEASTEEVRRALADGSAVVLDSRKRSEYAAGHIAGARNVDVPPAEYPAAVAQMVGGDKSKALILYCNGQYCQASRRLSETLAAAGFSNVRRYQLGIPMWRTLGGPVEIELDGVTRVFGIDRTAVWFDARSPEAFAKGTLAGAHNVPADRLGDGGLEKAPLPRDDFNTRVILFGRDAAQARRLADAVGRTPYQNVSYVPASYEALAAALKAK